MGSNEGLKPHHVTIYIASVISSHVYKIAENASSGEILRNVSLAIQGSLDRVSHPSRKLNLSILPSRPDIPQRYVIAACSADPDVVFCSFMGTKSASDVLVNVDTGLRRHENKLLWNRALGVLSTIKILRQYHCGLRKKRLILSGHSLGGMVAQLVFLLLVADGAEVDVGLITFGSPGVGFLIDSDKKGKLMPKLERRGDHQVPRINIVARSDLVVRGAQRVFGAGRVGGPSSYIGQLVAVDLPAGVLRGLHGLHSHGMQAYRELAERELLVTEIENEGHEEILSGDELIPRVSVRRVDVFEGERRKIFAHGAWLGLGRWIAVDETEQVVAYEDDFTSKTRRYPYMRHTSKL